MSVTYMSGDGKGYSSFQEALAHDPVGHRRRRSNWLVKVSRPDASGLRHIMVNGSIVGSILEDSSGVQRTRRSRGWIVTVNDAQLGGGLHGRKTYVASRLVDAISWAQEYPSWPVQCWVYMSGDHGYMPDNSGCCTSRDSAISSLIDLFELGNGRRARALRKYHYVDLDPHRDGASYCEVTPCTECEMCRALTVSELDTFYGECCSD
jgi:hypothetical protein